MKLIMMTLSLVSTFGLCYNNMRKFMFMKINDLLKFFKYVFQRPSLRILGFTVLFRSLLHPILERRLLNGISLPPRAVFIMVTDKCNFSCRMCQYSFSVSKEYQINNYGHMPSNVFQKAIDTIPGRPVISITGGEPLLHPKIGEYIRYIKNKDLFCILTTNGWLLDDHIPMLCNTGLDMLIVSIDGPEDVHDSIRKHGSFQKAVLGIENLLRQPKRPLVCISAVITDLNFDRLNEVVKLANYIGVDLININHLWIQTDAMVFSQNMNSKLPITGKIEWKLQVKNIKTEILIDKLKSITQEKLDIPLITSPNLNKDEIRVYYNNPEKIVKVHETRCAWLNLKIMPNGDVRICREHKGGNVLESPVRQIWNNSAYRYFRQNLISNKVCPICSRCCFLFPRI